MERADEAKGNGAKVCTQVRLATFRLSKPDTQHKVDGPAGILCETGVVRVTVVNDYTPMPPAPCPALLDMEKHGVHNAPEPIDELGLIGDLTPAAVSEVQRPSSFVSRRHLRDVHT